MVGKLPIGKGLEEAGGEWRKQDQAREWQRQAVRDGNRDGVWVELGVCTQGRNVGKAGVVRKLSGGVKMQ